MNALGKIVPFLCFLLLVGCHVGPHYEPPGIFMPEEWHSPTCDGMTRCEPDCDWWETFQDPLLDSLIACAADQNLDLNIAATRLCEAHMEAKGKCRETYPHIDFTTSCGDLYYNRRILNGTDKVGNKGFFEIGFDADWEFDLWGRVAHEAASLRAHADAAEETFNDVWVSLSAEIARNYIELRSLQARLVLLQRNQNAQADSVNLTQELVTIGMLSDLELQQARDQLCLYDAQRPLLELAVDKTIHRLGILLGYYPEDLFCELRMPCELPMLPCERPIGVPSELLRRRPDIRHAERNLAAATERVGSAMAGLFPRLSLKGFVGDISTCLKSLMDASAAAFFIAPVLSVPVFNSRLVTESVDYNKLKCCEAFYEYQKVVLLAIEEAENAIASFHYALKRHQALADSRNANRDMYDLVQDLYNKGIKDYLEVQMVHRGYIIAEDAYLQSQTDLLLHYIALYKAIGGGWDDCSDVSENLGMDELDRQDEICLNLVRPDRPGCPVRPVLSIFITHHSSLV